MVFSVFTVAHVNMHPTFRRLFQRLKKTMGALDTQFFSVRNVPIRSRSTAVCRKEPRSYILPDFSSCPEMGPGSKWKGGKLCWRRVLRTRVPKSPCSLARPVVALHSCVFSPCCISRDLGHSTSLALHRTFHARADITTMSYN